MVVGEGGETPVPVDEHEPGIAGLQPVPPGKPPRFEVNDEPLKPGTEKIYICRESPIFVAMFGRLYTYARM